MTKEADKKVEETNQNNQADSVKQNDAKSPDAKTDKLVDCAVLLRCRYGNNGDLIQLSVDEAKAAFSDGLVDTHPNAIKALKKAK